MVVFGNIIGEQPVAATQTYPNSAQFVGHSWRALWRMVRAMKLLWVTFTFATLAIWRVDMALTGPEIHLAEQIEFDLGLVAVSAGLALVGAVVTAAAAMIVLRAYLLDDTQDRPIWQVPPGFGRMAAWYVGSQALGQLVPMAAIASGLRGNWLLYGDAGAGLAIGFFLVQYFQLAPALAVGLPDAGFTQAWQDGRGRVWTYIGAMIMVVVRSLPILFVLILVTAIVTDAFQSHPPGFWGRAQGYGQAAGHAWDIALRWVSHSVGLVVFIILGARVQACLFAEARAADFADPA